MGDAAMKEGVGISGIKLDSLVKISNSEVEVPLVSVDLSSLAEKSPNVSLRTLGHLEWLRRFGAKVVSDLARRRRDFLNSDRRRRTWRALLPATLTAGTRALLAELGSAIS
jgi:hypothetical protein